MPADREISTKEKSSLASGVALVEPETLPHTNERSTTREPAPQQSSSSSDISSDISPEDEAAPDTLSEEAAKRPRNLRTTYLVVVVLLCLALLVSFFVWLFSRPMEVTLIEPKPAVISETVAGSGRVSGDIETFVGAQEVQGIVGSVFAQEGDRVKAGQKLATIKNDVAAAQVAQAQAALDRARAELAQITGPPLQSDVAAVVAQINGARAQVQQQQATVMQAERSVARSEAQLRQREAELELSSSQLERARTLIEQGVVARAEYDATQRDYKVAVNRVNEARRAVEEAESSLAAARAGITATQANVQTQQARLRTTQIRATPEQIEVARQRVAEAAASLRVAEKQAGSSTVVAPFNGTITRINAQPGQPIGSQGVFTLVSEETEIRLDLDENNLADLRLGQTATVTSSAFPGSAFSATIKEIAPSVNQDRGTILVKLRPVNQPDWLRPGQTVNVNIMTNDTAERLLIPAEAISRAGDRSVVFVPVENRAVEKTILTRAPTRDGVPVLAGLNRGDRIIAKAEGIRAGDRVRLK